MTTALIILLLVVVIALAVSLAISNRTVWDLEDDVRELLAQESQVDGPAPSRSFTIPPQTLEWQAEDCEILRHFLTQPTGRKLVEICGGEALQEAMKEAQGDRGNPKAAGMDAMLRFQFNLASETVRQKLSGDSAAQESKPADGEQNGAAPVEIRRSF